MACNEAVVNVDQLSFGNEISLHGSGTASATAACHDFRQRVPCELKSSTSTSMTGDAPCLLGLSRDLQVCVLMTISNPRDVRNLLNTCTALHQLAKDTQLVADWLLLHKRSQALWHCCSTGHSPAAQRLLKACDSPLKQTANNRTPSRTSYRYPSAYHESQHSSLPYGQSSSIPTHPSSPREHGQPDPLFVGDKDAEDALVISAQRGHQAVVKALLRWGVPANGIQGSGRPLTAASQAGQLECVLILMNGEDTSDQHLGGTSEANTAAETGKHRNRQPSTGECPPSMITPAKRRLFTEMNAANVDGSNGEDALVAAATGGHLPVVHALIRGGVSELHDSLVAAAGAGHLHVCKALISYGAKLHYQQYQSLVAASSGGHLDIMRWLWEAALAPAGHTQDPSRHTSDSYVQGDSNEHLPLPRAFPIWDNHQHDGEGNEQLLDLAASANRALIAAAGSGKLEAVRQLLSWGVDIKEDGEGAALCAACNGGHIPIVQCLLKAGADINAQDCCALKAAFETSNTELAKLLLSNGSGLPSNAASLLAQVAGSGNLELLTLMLDQGVDAHAADEAALRCAASKGATDVVKQLLGEPWKCDVHANDEEALLWAVDNGHEEVVKLLLAHGAVARGEAGEHMLWCAVRCGSQGIVKALMDAGASLIEA